MPRIPGPADRARALSILAHLLCCDLDFRERAEPLRLKRGDEYWSEIAEIRDTLHLPQTEWADGFLAALVQYFDDPLRVRTLVSHARDVHKLRQDAEGGPRWIEVDTDASSRWESVGTTLIDSQWTLWSPERPVATLSDLEERSGAPRWARRAWAEDGLPKGRRPTETLRKNVFLFYLVRWRGMSALEAALEVDKLADERRVQSRAKRGHQRLPSGERAFSDELLTGVAVRKALRRIDELFSAQPSIQGS